MLVCAVCSPRRNVQQAERETLQCIQTRAPTDPQGKVREGEGEKRSRVVGDGYLAEDRERSNQTKLISEL